MVAAFGLMAAALAAPVHAADAGFLALVEGAAPTDSAGRPVPRVERDAGGAVERLRLCGLRLTADDFGAVVRLGALRSLDLYRTNAADADLRALRGLPRLEGLNLTGTRVTDAGVDELAGFASLRSLCLGDVAVTPAAVERLKGQFRARGRKLALGYSPRR